MQNILPVSQTDFMPNNDSAPSLDLVTAVVGAVPAPLLVVGATGRIEIANDYAHEVFEYPAGELVGKMIECLLPARLRASHPTQRKKFMEQFHARTIGQGRELFAARRDGSEFPVEIGLGPLEVDGRHCVVTLVADVSERSRLFRQANYDSLTALANRSFFADFVHRALARAQRGGRKAALLYIDLDKFKSVNDRLGHEAGDKLLRSFAQRLDGCIRAGDLAARIGGDEFAVMLAEVPNMDAAFRAAEKILATIAPAHLVDGEEIEIRASIGVAMYPDDGVAYEALMKVADAAMYLAKRSARGRYAHRSMSPPS